MRLKNPTHDRHWPFHFCFFSQYKQTQFYLPSKKARLCFKLNYIIMFTNPHGILSRSCLVHFLIPFVYFSKLSIVSKKCFKENILCFSPQSLWFFFSVAFSWKQYLPPPLPQRCASLLWRHGGCYGPDDCFMPVVLSFPIPNTIQTQPFFGLGNVWSFWFPRSGLTAPDCFPSSSMCGLTGMRQRCFRAGRSNNFFWNVFHTLPFCVWMSNWTKKGLFTQPATAKVSLIAQHCFRDIWRVPSSGWPFCLAWNQSPPFPRWTTFWTVSPSPSQWSGMDPSARRPGGIRCVRRHRRRRPPPRGRCATSHSRGFVTQHLINLNCWILNTVFNDDSCKRGL